MNGPILIIVPCGKSKVWDRYPSTGPTRARWAYTGSPFKVNRDYALKFADFTSTGNVWVILSAKYGFITPDAWVEPYDVSFLRKTPSPISVPELKEQVRGMFLGDFGVVVGLGGKSYRERIQLSFEGTGVDLRFPFAGLPLGKSMSAIKRAIRRGEMFPK